ncbi:PEGA domain-containing protein [Candidatus Roizmanbacteria bacterium]|nr:PEGA domain-containing protein [Candidatus Roizmanbacteria bacterium]
MKGKLVLLTILILAFGIFVFVRFFILNNQNVFGRIKVVSSPVASVFIDNVAVGKTPFEEKYKVGEYILKLIPEGTATDTASWQGKVKIFKNALTYVNRELGSSDVTSAGEIFTTTKMEKPAKSGDYGEIYVETEPQGAIAYLDNDEKGVSALILSDVLKGDHELSVFMPGFLRRIQKINVDPGYRVNASFKLAIDQTQKATASGATKVTGGKESTLSAKTKKTFILVKDTPTGFLRVREEPSIAASESAQVKPGEKFLLLEEKEGWMKINYTDDKEGWVSGQYVEKQEE